MISVIRIYLLYLLTVLLQPEPAPQYRYRMQVNNTFTVNDISCPSKANTWRFKSISCDRNSQNNALTHGKLQGCQTQRSDMHMTAEMMQTNDLLKLAITRSNGSAVL